MSRAWIPAAGDLITIDFNPQAGHKQAGRRPAIVLSPLAFNSSQLHVAVVCPITSKVKGYPFEVPLPAGLKIIGVVLSDHVKTVDWKARKAKRVDTAPRSVLDAVRRHVSLIVGNK